MTKNELREKIKGLVKQVYKPTTTVDLDSSAEVDISLEAEKFPLLLKFPELKRVLVDLLTDQYEVFVKDIQWVAPKPTTFRIVLANDETFNLIWAVRSWLSTVEGKRYYLLNLNEEERATEAISRILAYGNGQAESMDASGELATSEEAPPEEASAETETATEEPAAEETPTEEA